MKNYDGFFAGIDLGTTNSAISILEESGTRLTTPVIPVERRKDFGSSSHSRMKEKTLPSAVLYAAGSNGEFDIYVGDGARDAARYRPYAVAMSVKEQMGQPELDYPGWQYNCPDQTPHEVSSRILKHLLDGVEKEYGDRPVDAVITVPANYSALKREATLKAAELAGLNVRESDGSYRDDVLLSEPEAVIYHVLNQKQNGDLAMRYDFCETKNVMVYDMGGGTLDITLHEVRQNPGDPDIYEMKLIATNRFSDMAGNTIDRMLARQMYQRYMEELSQYDEATYRAAQKERDHDERIFERMAEDLKIQLNERVTNFKRRGSELSGDAYFDYGGLLTGGRQTEGSMTRKEIENCLRSCLGEAYSYQDYKRFDRLDEQKNMLYPVLQVLHRAAEKLNAADLKVDLVILNGGMSKFYLVRENLERFFGFPMTAVNDPDTSVAQGASVYHYYRARKGAAIKGSSFEEIVTGSVPAGAASTFRFRDVTRQIRNTGTVLNETLYLGVRCGASVLLAQAGVDLPYQSATELEFTLSAGERCIEIPLREIHGTKEVTVGRSRICFARFSTKPQPVMVRVNISRSGLLSLDVHSPMGKGTVEILLGDECTDKSKCIGKALNPPVGTKLIPANQMSQLKSLVKQVDGMSRKSKMDKRKHGVVGQIQQCVNNIQQCGNPEDFAEPILQELSSNSSEALVRNLLLVAEQLCPRWTQAQRKKLSGFAVQSLSRLLCGLGDTAFRAESNRVAIRVIGACGVAEDLKKLEPLMENHRYAEVLKQVQCGGSEM